jgi:peptidoglycan hydrolase-like protein with peptidoglycan-binding domain
LSRIASIESGAKDAAATRNLSKGIDPATFKDEANQTTEDQIGLDKGQRRDVQRRLTGLGFDTKITGQFDPPTRAVITRWQAARGYPKSGYLNKLQHKALLTEIVAAAPTASSEEDRPKRRTSSQQAQPQVQHQAPPPQRQYAPGPDPAGAGRFIGGVMGGMLR